MRISAIHTKSIPESNNMFSRVGMAHLDRQFLQDINGHDVTGHGLVASKEVVCRRFVF